MRILKSKYEIDGISYKYITLYNKKFMEIKLSTCGAGIKEIRVPDKNGIIKTVTLAPVDNERYNQAYHGKIIGRTSGRIENATFTIDEKTANLEKNNQGIDNLHGGTTGLHRQNFEVSIEENIEFTDVVFTYFSPDGEGGYFGNINITITYRVYENINKFIILINGQSDCKNLLNITNHVYWNLSGNLNDTVLDHNLMINASKRGVLNERSILVDIVSVEREFDFKVPKRIGDDIMANCVQLNTTGYDHPFYLDSNEGIVSSLYSKESGLKLNIKTSYPVVVCYSNNYPEYDVEVYKNIYDSMHMAVCLECQYSPNGIKMTPDKAGIFDKEYKEFIEYDFLLQ